MHLKRSTSAVSATIILLLNLEVGRGGITLDALGLYLTKNGYGGAQLIQLGNFYHLPVQSSGKPGNLIVDTGSPTSLIFRSSLKRLNLIESKTTDHVIGVFGQGRDLSGLTTVKALTAGNCTLTNVPVSVASDSSFSRPRSNGLLGLRELVKFGAVLDLRNRLIYLRPSRPDDRAGSQIKSILSRQGYTAVPLLIKYHHLFVSGALNGIPCYFVVDTGGYLTTLDANFAARAKLKVEATPLIGESFGSSSPVGIAIFPSLRIGNYQIKHGSVSVVHLDPEIFGSKSEIAGLIGVEYLSINCAIFDFASGALYLRPPPH